MADELVLLFGDLTNEPPAINYVDLSDAPGWGVELNSYRIGTTV
jgi:L-alanine-DL-glutamate epimerase-like enolase superfamily enzyme